MQFVSLAGARRLAFAAAAVLCAVSLAGCGKGFDPSVIGTFRMGEKIQMGKMVYTILEAQWKPALNDAGTGKPPKDRYLFVRVSATNSGGEMMGIPPLQILNSKKQTISEVTEGVEEVSNYLGVFRMVQPAQTEQGYVVFDAPIGSYKLMISDGGEPGSEKYAQVDLPVQLE